MDLGLQGKTAIVCAASRGLGRACARSLAANGVQVTIAARTPGPLEETTAEIRRDFGVEAAAVAADITTPEGRELTLAACPRPDILVNNAGGPPPGDFRDWGRENWIKSLAANMLSAIEMIRATVDGMIERRFGRIVNITSSAVKAPIASLGLSSGARAGLTGFVAGLARQTVRHNVTINNLLPGPFDTDRLRDNARAAAALAGAISKRSWRSGGSPSGGPLRPAGEFGAACAFLCGGQAGYITGQNLLIDGGGYPGTL